MSKEGLTAKQCQHAQPREKRYEMPAGEWRDTDKELEWAVKSLIK